MASQKLQPSNNQDESSLNLKLQHAVLHGNLNEVRELFNEHQIDINETSTTNDHSLLHYACAAGHIDVVQYLLNYEGIDVLCKDKASMIPLLYACALGHVEVAELLIEFLLKTYKPKMLLEKCSFVTSDNSVINPLHIITATGTLKIMKLLALKFSEEIRNEHLYLSLNHRNTMEYLLCTLSFTSSDLITALYIALKQNILTAIQFIVAMTASNYKNVELHKENLLHISCLSGTLSVVMYFIECLNYNPNITGENSSTPLHYAARNNHIDLVKYLTGTHQCDPLVKDHDNNTSLHVAALGGGLEVIKYFTNDLKIDVCLTGQYKRTALHHAAKNGHFHIVTSWILTTVIHLSKIKTTIRHYIPSISLRIWIGINHHYKQTDLPNIDHS